MVQEVLWEGTQETPLPTLGGVIPTSGRRIAIDATLWYRFDGAQIAAIRHHLDLFSMLQQLGALESTQQEQSF